MLKTLKLKGKESSFYWTSDNHFHHIQSFLFKDARGYSTIQEHDEDLIKNWNNTVSNEDIVFNLGDFYLYSDKPEDSLNILRRLNFQTLYMLWGNHNASVKQLYQTEIKSQYGINDVEIYPIIKNLGNKQIVFVGEYLESFINNQHIVMSHYSYRSWHKNGKGSWNLCGHSHGNDKGINPQCPNNKILDVGVDNFRRPINMTEIRKIMDSKTLGVTDHH